jgi:hypothetical protein
MDGAGTPCEHLSTMTATRISLELGCSEACDEVSELLFTQLSGGAYDECAVLPLTKLHEWRNKHRTARRRAARACDRGYAFNWMKKHLHADDIHRINLSASHRQGRPMSAGYHKRPSETPLPDYPCHRHRVSTYGVVDREGVWVAYAVIHRAGELALVSQILGHADHLENEIMYLLVQGIVRYEHGGGYLVYNRYDSGTDGLRFFKDRCGFARTDVEWAP